MSRPRITIRWNGDEAVIDYSPAFDNADPIIKGDMLKDAIYELDEHYGSIIANGGIFKVTAR